MTFLEYLARDFRAARVISTPDGVYDLISMIPTGKLSRDERTLVKDLRLMTEMAGLARSEDDVKTDTEYLEAWGSAVDLLSPAESPLRQAKIAFVQILRRVLYRAPRIRAEGKSWDDFHAEDLSTILRVDAEQLRSRAVADVPNIHHWDGLCYDSWRGYANSVLIRVARARLEAGTIPSTPDAPILGDAGDPLPVSAVVGLTQSGRCFIRQFGVYATTESVAHYTGTDIVEVSAIDYY